MTTVDICVVCAWRGTCQKKFSVSGRDAHCPDFTRDLSLDTGEGDQIPQDSGSAH